MKATTIVGMVLGILGGIIALVIGAGGFGLASVGGQLSGAIGYKSGVSSASFYKIAAVAIPIMAILGAGLAPKAIRASAFLQIASAVGMLLVFGISSISIIPVALIGMGALFVGMDFASAKPNSISSFRLDARSVVACGVGALVLLCIVFFSFLAQQRLPFGTLILLFLTGISFIAAGIFLGPLRGVVSAFLAAIVAVNLLYGNMYPDLMLLIGGPLAAGISGRLVRGRGQDTLAHLYTAGFLGNMALLLCKALADNFLFYGSLRDVGAMALSLFLVPIIATAVVLGGGRILPNRVALQSKEIN